MVTVAGGGCSRRKTSAHARTWFKAGKNDMILTSCPRAVEYRSDLGDPRVHNCREDAGTTIKLRWWLISFDSNKRMTDGGRISLEIA